MIFFQTDGFGWIYIFEIELNCNIYTNINITLVLCILPVLLTFQNIFVISYIRNSYMYIIFSF